MAQKYLCQIIQKMTELTNITAVPPKYLFERPCLNINLFRPYYYYQCSSSCEYKPTVVRGCPEREPPAEQQRGPGNPDTGEVKIGQASTPLKQTRFSDRNPPPRRPAPSVSYP